MAASLVAARVVPWACESVVRRVAKMVCVTAVPTVVALAVPRVAEKVVK